MAEAVAIVGVLAAAAQFGDIGCRIVLRVSSLLSKVNDNPRCLQRALDQIRLLLHLAELTNKKVTEESNIRRPLIAQALLSDEVPSLQPLPILPLTWLESVWQNCSVQAYELDGLISPILEEMGSGGIRKTWKKIWTVKNEEKVEKIMAGIERYKTLLSMGFGQECLDQMAHLQKGVIDIRGDIDSVRWSITKLNQAFQKLVPAGTSEPPGSLLDALQHQYCKNTALHGQQILSVIQSQERESSETRQQLQLLTTEIQQVRSEVQDLSTDRKKMVQKKSIHSQQGKLGGQATATASAVGNRHAFGSQLSRCKCRLVDWRRLYWLGGTRRLMIQSSHSISEHCPIHHKRKRSSKEAMHYRQKIPFIGRTLEFTLLVCQSSGCPSVGISLRTEARVKVLPLYSFFMKLYRSYNYPKGNSKDKSSLERQDYLLNLARKTLLHAFRSGDASPDDVDSEGRTLLHLQAEYCSKSNESFLARMINLVLSMGVRADMLDDSFRTAQQTLVSNLCYRTSDNQFTSYAASFIGTDLLDWTGFAKSTFLSVSDILDCVNRWPESMSDLDYPEICDIVLRRSIDDLKKYVSGPIPPKEWTPRQSTPLHFAAAADWLEGVKVLIAYGVNEHAEDSESLCPLDIAIRIQSVAIVGIFLKSDCRPYNLKKRRYQTTTLRPSFLLAAQSDNEELQDVVVKALARQRHELYKIRPYHDLAKVGGCQAKLFAEKLFSAGIRNIEGYDEDGMTPLMRACYSGSRSMVAFLLSHGANRFKKHREADLRPGHFVTYISDWWDSWDRSRNDLRSKDESTLLEAAFQDSDRVDSKCRCSPDGFSPLTAMFRRTLRMDSYSRKCVFEEMIRYLNPQRIDIIRQWRCLVAVEIFDRLELTHTCIEPSPTVRKFPEEDRLEIEEEEEELFHEFERLMNDYDELQRDSPGDIADCVNIFFDTLDHDLRPLQSRWPGRIYCGKGDADILGSGKEYQCYWLSSRGKKVRYGHKEEVKECYMLDSLFN